jgi:hypothetical protein
MQRRHMTTLPLKVYIDRFILSQKKPKSIVNDVSDINFIYYISLNGDTL